jgi:secreted trypsin-like serine protease
MRRLVLTLVLIVCSLLLPTIAMATPAPKVAGGYVPNTSSWPWVTYIESSVGSCTASLITPTRLLTASHCVVKNEEQAGNRNLVPASDWSVWIDRRNTTTLPGIGRRVTGVASNPAYSGPEAHNDVAVMFLNAPVTGIPTAPLGDRRAWGYPVGNVCGTNQNETCYQAYAMGWGHINYNHDSPIDTAQLQAGSFILGSDPYCGFLINGRGWDTYVPGTQICAYDYDGQTCITHGDSGGPLMVYVNGQWVQIGVASHFPSPLDWGKCQGGTNVITETWVAGDSIRNWVTSVSNPACAPAVHNVRRLKRLNKRYYGYKKRLRKARRWKGSVCSS